MDNSERLTLLPLFDELRGAKVIVRPYRAEDAQALQEAVTASRDHLRPWLPFADFHQTVEESKDWIIQQEASWLLRESLALSVWDAADPGRFLGGLGLHPRNWSIRYFEIGYWLSITAEGHGYMVEAVGLLVDFAMNSLAANRLEIRCDARNNRSAGVARRLGFVEEGCLRNNMTDPAGALRNTLIFSRIPGDAINS